jgi:6-phosphogluconolactonase
MTSIEVFKDAPSLARAGAGRFVDRAAAAIGARGRFAVALSGGSTPRGMYALLAGDEHVHRVDWARVHLFFGDERCVPPEHPDSNYRMVRETLLAYAPLPPGNMHRMRGEDPPAEAALAYESDLRAFFGSAAAPRFDLVLLGMGDNGHTASLFPGLPQVREQVRWVAACYVDEVGMWRLTLTPVAINAAAEVTFLVAGAGKAAMLRRVLEGPYQPDLLPAQSVRPTDGLLRWMVDEAAAGDLARLPCSVQEPQPQPVVLQLDD